MIDDINTSDTKKWKYVNDATIVEPVVKNWASTIQVYVNKFVAKLDANKFQLNDSKCKETRIFFAKIDDGFAPVIIKGKEIEVVFSQLLGLNISKDLKWTACHVSEISRKVSAKRN